MRIIRSALILLLLFFCFALSKNIYSQAAKFKEIYRAESEVRSLTKKQEELKNTLERQKSEFFLEKQARDKLSLQKPGEVLYVILDQGEEELKKKEQTKKNWEVWLDFLFR